MMEDLVIRNPLPQADWMMLADFFHSKYNWVKENQKLIIHFDETYKIATLVTFLNEIVEMLKICNEFAGLEVFYEEILIHETLKTIPQGIIEPMVVSRCETISDKRQVNVFENRETYLLKIN